MDRHQLLGDTLRFISRVWIEEIDLRVPIHSPSRGLYLLWYPATALPRLSSIWLSLCPLTSFAAREHPVITSTRCGLLLLMTVGHFCGATGDSGSSMWACGRSMEARLPPYAFPPGKCFRGTRWWRNSGENDSRIIYGVWYTCARSYPLVSRSINSGTISAVLISNHCSSSVRSSGAAHSRAANTGPAKKCYLGRTAGSYYSLFYWAWRVTILKFKLHIYFSNSWTFIDIQYFIYWYSVLYSLIFSTFLVIVTG